MTEVRYNNLKKVGFFYDERGQRLRKENYTSTGGILTTDHLGNVRAVINNTNGAVKIEDYADYYPFGEKLPSRNLFSQYRYAFQGQELDPETGKEAFQLRLWDGRIGRWLTTDPYGQYHSPYLGMGNNPISGIDPDGGYLFGLFGSTSDQRALTRAERFSEKNNGRLVNNDKELYVITNESDGTCCVHNSKFGDFSSLSNFGKTLIDFDKALSGSSDGFNTGGSYSGISGMRKVSKASGDFGNSLENTGLALTATVWGVPVGAPMVVIGGATSFYSTSLSLIADYSESKNKDFSIKVGG